MKKIRLVKPFRAYSPGTVLDLPGGQASELVLYGIAVEEKQRDLLDTAAVEQEVRTADATPRRRRKP